MNLGARVKQRREQLGMAQHELAALVGVKQAAISALELRDSRSSRQLSKLAEALQCSPEWLESGEGDPTEKYVLRENTAAYNTGCSLPFLEFKQLIQLGSGELELSEIPRTYEDIEPVAENAFVLRVWDDKNSPLLWPGSNVMVDKDEPVQAGDFGLFYLDVGTVALARFDGYRIEYVSSSTQLPAPPEFKTIGRVMATLRRSL